MFACVNGSYYSVKKMETLSIILKSRLRNSLSRTFLSIPEEFICDAICDAYSAFLWKAPVHVTECPKKTFRWMRTVAARRLFVYCKNSSRCIRLNNKLIKILFAETDNSFDDRETIHSLMQCL